LPFSAVCSAMYTCGGVCQTGRDSVAPGANRARRFVFAQGLFSREGTRVAVSAPGTVHLGPCRGGYGHGAVSQSEHELSHPKPPAFSGQHGLAHDEMLAIDPAHLSDYRHGMPVPHPVEAGSGHPPPASSTCTASSFALAAVLAVELAFVLGVIVLAKLSPAHAVDAAASTTAVAVAGFYSRNAVVTIGRRLIGSAEHDQR
jgi:hypothetical protein